MNKGLHREAEARPRVIRGEHGWWFLGPGGIARLTSRHLTPAETLRPAAERSLRERGLFTARRFLTYSLTVLTTTRCNLGCAYCFQNVGQDTTGGNRPPRIDSSRLTSDTITSILDFTGRKQAESGLRLLTLILFGGEPLLNPRGCLELLERAGGYGLHQATMVSNGTLLTPSLARQLSGLGLRDVQVTFDGDRPDHDRIRVRRTGGGTFDAIVAAMAKVMTAAPIRFVLRVNVSHENHEGIGALIERLATELDPARCTIYFSRVGDVEIGYRNDLVFSAEQAARFIQWQRRALDLGFAVPRPSVQKPCQACSFKDGRYGAVVNSDGTLFSCWETAGKPGWEVGAASGGYLPGARTEGRWVSCEESYRYAVDLSAVARFNDMVDAAHLDYLSATGRLSA
jgi:uncharacterized protein